MILAVETSYKYLSMALASDYEKIIFELNWFLEFSHCENFNKFLDKFDIDFSKLKEVIISKGPGLFTSLRISSAFAKALKIVYPSLH